jgi:hypothetical protein
MGERKRIDRRTTVNPQSPLLRIRNRYRVHHIRRGRIDRTWTGDGPEELLETRLVETR